MKRQRSRSNRGRSDEFSAVRPTLFKPLKAQNKRKKPISFKDQDQQPAFNSKIQPTAHEQLTLNSVFNPLKANLIQYFKESKHIAKNAARIMPPGFAVGDLCLGAVGAKGPGFKYLVLHFNRLKKGFVDPKECSQNGNQQIVRSYRQGQFVVAKVVSGHVQHNVQLSLRASQINLKLKPKELIPGQVVVGELLSIEKSVVQVGLRGAAKCTAFCRRQLLQKCTIGKCSAWRVKEVSRKPCTVQLEPSFDQEQSFNFKGIEEQIFEQLQLQMFLTPGSLVDCMVIAASESGLVVKFLRCCYGYILTDHLSQPSSSYIKNQRVLARIIYAGMNPPAIYLSEKHRVLPSLSGLRACFSLVKGPHENVLDLFPRCCVADDCFVHSSEIPEEQQDHVKYIKSKNLWVKWNNIFEGVSVCTTDNIGLRVGQKLKRIPEVLDGWRTLLIGPISQTQKYQIVSIDDWDKTIKFSQTPLVSPAKQRGEKGVGVIVSVSGRGALIEFRESLMGMLPFREVKRAKIQLQSLSEGQSMEVYVASVVNGRLQLSVLPPTQAVIPLQHQHQSKTHGQLAVVKSVKQSSIVPLFVSVRGRQHALSAFAQIVPPLQASKLNHLQKFYSSGQTLPFVETEGEIFLYDPSIEKRQDLLICRIVNVNRKGLRVQISPDKFANVAITEIQDSYSLNVQQLPFTHADWKGQYHTAVLLRQEGQLSHLSLRQSLIKLGIPKSMAQCSKNFSDAERNGDYRARTAMYGAASMKVGMIFMGYVLDTSIKGCFISISSSVTVRVPFTELSDRIVKDSAAQFYPGKLVLGRIIGQKNDPAKPMSKYLEGSLRRSIIQFGYCLNAATLRAGVIVQGHVTGYTSNSAIIAIKGCKERGVLSPSQLLQNRGLVLQKEMPLGRDFKQIGIVQYKREDGKSVIKLSEKMALEMTQSAYKTSQERRYLDELLENVQEINQLNHQAKTEAATNQEDLKEDQLHSRLMTMLQTQEPAHIEDEIQADSDPGQAQQQLQFQQEEQSQDQPRKDNPATLQLEPLPYDSAHYQTLLLTKPCLETHLLYLSALIQESRGTQQVRCQFLKAIASLSSLKDKEALWISFLNFQAIINEGDKLSELVKKATASGAGKQFFFRLCQILHQRDEWKLLVQIARAVVKKWSHSSKVWLVYVRYMTEYRHLLEKQGQKSPLFSQPSNIMQRVRDCVKSHKHILIQQHIALSQYQAGEAQLGRSTFQQLISQHPSRLDLWSVYIDSEIKLGEFQRARLLFKRGLSLNLKRKKLRFFGQKWVQMQERRGESERLKEAQQALQQIDQ